MAAVVSNNSEELILELFDVLERCPPRARDCMRTMAESRFLAPRGDLARAEGASSHAAAPG